MSRENYRPQHATRTCAPPPTLPSCSARFAGEKLRVPLGSAALTLRDPQSTSSRLLRSCTVNPAGARLSSCCWLSGGGPGLTRFCPSLVRGGGAYAVAASSWRSFQSGVPSVGLRLVEEIHFACSLLLGCRVLITHQAYKWEPGGSLCHSF